MVAIDIFMTDTARFADIVLPAASFLEFDDLTAGYFNLSIGVQSKVIEPQGSSLPNQDIFRRLAAAMGLEQPALRESDRGVLENLLRQAGFIDGFEAFREQGFLEVNGSEPHVAWADRRFPTPSGRIEIASEVALELGLPRLPHRGTDALPNDGWLRLLSPASNWRLNDSYANDPRLRRRSGPAELTIHPDDAERLAINTGDAVRVSNTTGTLMLVAEVSDVVVPGTVMSYKGRWPSQEDDGLNALYDGTANDMGESSAVHGVEVQVRPAGPDESPAEASS